MLHNSTTKIVTKLQKKLEFLQNSKTWIGTKFNAHFDKFQKLKLRQNSTNQTVTKLRNSNSNRKKNFGQKSFLKNNWTPRQTMRCIRNVSKHSIAFSLIRPLSVLDKGNFSFSSFWFLISMKSVGACDRYIYRLFSW